VRSETERASTSVDGLRATYLARGAVELGILYIFWGRQAGTAAGAMPRYYAPGRPVIPMSFSSGEAVVEVIPETAKLNLNRASPEDLDRLLLALGAEPRQAHELLQGILAYRTPQASGPQGSILSPAQTFQPGQASFEEIEELLLFRAMTPDLYYGSYDRVPGPAGSPGRLVRRLGLAECLSIYGAAAGFEANTAPPAVLAAAGLPPEAVAAIVERRRLMPFQHLGQVSDLLGPEAAGKLRLGGSSIFTVRATARLRLSNGQLSDLRRSVAALVKMTGPEFYHQPHVLRWYDTVWSQ